MRLSDLLNQAPAAVPCQVENFLGSRKIGWGGHKKIKVGKVVHNFYCRSCSDHRTFQSHDELSCLVVGDRQVSIDVTLRCPTCSASVETWFLVASDGDMYAPAPTVHLERYIENRRDMASGFGTADDEFGEMLERAQTAYDNQLGAGAMIYLRKIFETITRQVAEAADIPIERTNGKSRPFKELLEEVNGEHHIIPARFSDDGYRLFGELSEVIHGDSDEDVALLKYKPCQQLILGVLNNVKDDRRMAEAIDALGWDIDNLNAITGEEVVS